MMTHDELVALLKKNAPDAVIVAASEIIDNDSTIAWPYMLRSEALLATGHLGRALGDLHMAMSIEPSEAIRQRIDALQNVIAFRNTDILNP